MPSNGALDLTIRIMGKVDPSLAKSISSVTKQAGSISTVIGNIGKAGLAMTGAVAVAAAGVIGSTTKAAQTFEDQMSDVAKYVGGLTDEAGNINVEPYNEMADAILRLSTELPYSIENLTRMAAAMGESGKTAGEIMGGLLRDTAMVGVALDISGDQAGDWATKWEEALSMPHDQIMDLFDQINYMAANSATTAVEIGEVVNRVASLGQVTGMDPDATAALATGLLSMGMDSARAATSIKNIYTNLTMGASATDRMTRAWDRLGMDAVEVAKAMQSVDEYGNSLAPDTLISVFEAIGQLPEYQRLSTINDLFGRWPMEAAAKVAQNPQFIVKLLNDANGTDWMGSMEKELIVKTNTAEGLDEMFGNAVTRFMVTLGNNFLPVKKELAMLGIDMMNGITDSLPDLTRLAEAVMPMLRSAVEGIGNAVQDALPHIQNAIDYVVNNKDTVTQWATGLVGLFAVMSAAPAVSGIASTVLGPAAGLMSVSPSRGQRFASGAAGAVSGLGGTIQAARIGAQMANSSMTQVNGEAAGGGLFNTLLGAAFGVKNRNALTSGKGSDRTWWNRAIGVADQIATAKQGGIGGVISGLFAGTRIGNYAKGIADTKIGGGLIGAAKTGGGVMGEILSGIAGFTGLSGAVTGVKAAGAGALAKVGSLAPVQALGSVAGGIAGGVGNVLGFGGTVMAPLASGFMSLLGTFGPVIAGIGGIVAVVSILGDNLDGIRTVVGNIFGPAGVQVLDNFVGGITNIGNAIQNALSPEGLANIQETITKTFGPGAGAAFGTLIPLIQTVTGIFGQIVDLGVNHLKPLILEVWEFLSGTLFPAVIPLLSTVIGLVGTALVNAVKVIVDVVKAVTPVVEPVITGIIGLIQGIADTAVSVVNFVIRALNKLSFTVPDWVPVIGGSQFGFNLQEVSLPQFANGGFATRPSIAGEDGPETIIPHDPAKRSRAIALWLQTGSILGLNSFADGGFTNGMKAWGVSALAGLALGSAPGVAFTKGIKLLNVAADAMQLAGANSAEARKFISTARAGARLRGGMGYLASMDGLNLPDLTPRRSAGSMGRSIGGSLPAITFAPQITVSGSMSEEDVNKLVELLYQKFAEFMDRYNRERRRTSYA